MSTITDKLGNIHFEHQMWLKELAFCKSEMALYERRLVEKYKDYDQDDLPDEVLELMGQMLSFNNTVERLIAQINQHVLRMDKLAQSNGELSHLINTSHPEVRLEISVFRKDYLRWKESLHHLLAVTP